MTALPGFHSRSARAIATLAGWIDRWTGRRGAALPIYYGHASGPGLPPAEPRDPAFRDWMGEQGDRVAIRGKLTPPATFIPGDLLHRAWQAGREYERGLFNAG
jgi:hypothetical protein